MVNSLISRNTHRPQESGLSNKSGH